MYVTSRLEGVAYRVNAVQRSGRICEEPRRCHRRSIRSKRCDARRRSDGNDLQGQRHRRRTGVGRRLSLLFPRSIWLLGLMIRCTLPGRPYQLRLHLENRPRRRDRRLLQGLGRPQGLAFDNEGNCTSLLHTVVAWHRAHLSGRYRREVDSGRLIQSLQSYRLHFSFLIKPIYVNIFRLYHLPLQKLLI
jgi:hypothetical protein